MHQRGSESSYGVCTAMTWLHHGGAAAPRSPEAKSAIGARVRAHKISRMPEYAKLTSAKIDKPSIVGGYPMNTAT